MKPNKDSGNKFISTLQQNLLFIVGVILFILFVVLLNEHYKSIPKKKVVPHVRIDYINPDGTVRYSKYSNDVNYGRGSIYYVDFYTGCIVNTTETVNITRIN